MWSWTERRHMLGRPLKPRKFLVVWLVGKHMDDLPERIMKIPMHFLNILYMVFFPGNPYLGICHWTIGQLHGWWLQKTLCLPSIGQVIFRTPACLSTQRCTLMTVHTPDCVSMETSSQSRGLSVLSLFPQSGDVHLRSQRYKRQHGPCCVSF